MLNLKIYPENSGYFEKMKLFLREGTAPVNRPFGRKKRIFVP